MTTYARIVDNFVVDVVVTPPELVDRFNPDWLAQQTFIVVPDGTIHGAADNGDGTYTNPPTPEPVIIQSTPDPVAAVSKQITDLTNALASAFPGVGQAINSSQPKIG